ncbi:hypothetical protein DFH11DRAFT_453991, partial [Phellopilus nigrolimitatus]
MSQIQNNPSAEEACFLHLKEIMVDFKVPHPNSKFSVKIVEADKSYESPVFGKEDEVKWESDLYIASSVAIELVVQEVHIAKLDIKKRYASVKKSFTVTVDFTFADSQSLQNVARLLGEKANSALASKADMLGTMGKVLDHGEVVMKLAEVVAELNPFAKVAVGAVKIAFEKCKKISKGHEDALALMDELVSLLPLPGLVQDKVKTPEVKMIMESFLSLVKEADEALIKYASPSKTRFLKKNLTSKQDAFTKLKSRLNAMKPNMNLYLDASIQAVVVHIEEVAEAVLRNQELILSNQEHVLLKELQPVISAYYDPKHSCLSGTRVDLLQEIGDWSTTQGQTSKLFWMHGIAGSGKSTIASSVASMSYANKCLAGCFFFKRDIPEHRNPQSLFPSLTYSLAILFKPFRDAIFQVLQTDPAIAGKAVSLQFEALFRGPISKCSQSSPLKPIIMVIDALDECGDAQDRSMIASYLTQLANLAPWLKVFVSSRPYHELQDSFNMTSHPWVHKLDLNNVDARQDIYTFTELQIKAILEPDSKWLQEENVRALSDRAAGLFIWISTVARFIADEYEKETALQEILLGTFSAADGPEVALDELYSFVLRGIKGSGRNQKLLNTVLGVIVSTARNRPLPVSGIFDLLPSVLFSSQPAVQAILKDLQSVLYKDSALDGAIRVCHPSFLDFMTNKSRSGPFWTNPTQVDSEMATRCLQIMHSQLKFNICKLESSHVPNKDITDLQHKVSQHIPQSLQYSCRYWMDHISYSEVAVTVHQVHDLVQNILCQPKALFWLEALSLMGELKSSIDILDKASLVFKDSSGIGEASTDLYRFVSAFYEAIATSTPHLYVSALSWAPSDSYVAKVFYASFSNQSFFVSGKPKTWRSN